MAMYGYDLTVPGAQIVFIVYACLSAIFGVVSIVFLQQLYMLPVFLLPLLCFCITYDNTLLSMGSNIDPQGNVAYAGNVFNALEIPIFVIILHETSFRLFQSRSLQFCFIRFDQTTTTLLSASAFGLLWSVRVISIGLFIMRILYNFSATPAQDSCIGGLGGYLSFQYHTGCVSIALKLIPCIILSFVAITVGLILFRYGSNLTIRLKNARRWRSMLIHALLYAVCQIWGSAVYALTSNAGDIQLLLGVTLLVFLVQEDFSLAGSFADFLRSSNVAFLESNEIIKSRKASLKSIINIDSNASNLSTGNDRNNSNKDCSKNNNKSDGKKDDEPNRSNSNNSSIIDMIPDENNEVNSIRVDSHKTTDAINGKEILIGNSESTDGIQTNSSNDSNGTSGVNHKQNNVVKQNIYSLKDVENNKKIFASMFGLKTKKNNNNNNNVNKSIENNNDIENNKNIGNIKLSNTDFNNSTSNTNNRNYPSNNNINTNNSNNINKGHSGSTRDITDVNDIELNEIMQHAPSHNSSFNEEDDNSPTQSI